MSTDTKKLTFTCECSGCNGYRNDYNRASVEAVIAEIGGHYFSPDARRFFGSRPTWWITVSDGRVIVRSTEKAGFEDSLGRVQKLTLFCPYGVVIEHAKFNTLHQAQKALFSFYGDTVCTCHGCRIDRSGR
jgi:hypothetical protein